MPHRHCESVEALGHVLERARRERYHGFALRTAQQPLRRLLGESRSRGLSLTNLSHTQPLLEPSDLGLNGPSRAALPEVPVGPLEGVERNMIERALTMTGGHQQQAAELLGISRRTLSRKLKRYESEMAPQYSA